MDEYEKGELHCADACDSYNATITERFERVRDYIVAHYKLNTRNDSDYWRDNRNNNNLSEPLLKLLDVWFRKGDLTQRRSTDKTLLAILAQRHGIVYLLGMVHFHLFRTSMTRHG